MCIASKLLNDFDLLKIESATWKEVTQSYLFLIYLKIKLPNFYMKNRITAYDKVEKKIKTQINTSIIFHIHVTNKGPIILSPQTITRAWHSNLSSQKLVLLD